MRCNPLEIVTSGYVRAAFVSEYDHCQIEPSKWTQLHEILIFASIAETMSG